jgi:hypothetical protein
MTAEIAILNTHGVALAADSAITINTGDNLPKIYNSANKIFTLSKYQPIGIMIFNSANFMDIEWEIIIKEYRRKLGDDHFDSLLNYANDFIKYIENLEYVPVEVQTRYLFSLCLNVFYCVRNTFIENLKDKYGESIEDISNNKIAEVFNDTIKEIKILQEKRDDEKCFTLDIGFIKSNLIEIDKAIQIVFENFIVLNEQRNELINILCNDIQKGICIRQGYSGLVITGYGGKEIFPSIYVCNICGKIGTSLIRFNEEKDAITFNHTASIRPFAQTEMVCSFMEGIDPEFENTIIKQIKTLIDAISREMDKSYQEKLDIIKNDFLVYIAKFKNDVYINPIMDIVQSLQKSDLAEMAEALVNLTSFKRHISKESETVGGPTDVAVISKADGFIWIKRKHYFDIDLNRHFLENYYRGEGNE